MDARTEAGAIIAHYFKALAQAAGRRWTPANDHDMQRLAELLTDDQAETIAPYYAEGGAERHQPVPKLPTEPARQIRSAVTQVLDKPARRQRADASDLDDEDFQRWRRERRAEDDQARRMLQRERPGR